MTAMTSACDAVAGSSRWMLAMPTSAQSLCLPLTYARLPGSSPTSTVPSPGVTPCSASAATRCFSSSRIAAAVALPSRIVAVTHRSFHALTAGSVEEVPDASEIEGDTGLVRGSDDVGVPDRTTRLDDRADAGFGEHLESIREREERVTRGDRAAGPIPRPRDGEPRRVDAVDLTHADTDR